MGYFYFWRGRAVAMNSCEVNPVSAHYGLLHTALRIHGQWLRLWPERTNTDCI